MRFRWASHNLNPAHSRFFYFAPTAPDRESAWRAPVQQFSLQALFELSDCVLLSDFTVLLSQNTVKTWISERFLPIIRSIIPTCQPL
jgi:hypothetical protein